MCPTYQQAGWKERFFLAGNFLRVWFRIRIGSVVGAESQCLTLFPPNLNFHALTSAKAVADEWVSRMGNGAINMALVLSTSRPRCMESVTDQRRKLDDDLTPGVPRHGPIKPPSPVKRVKKTQIQASRDSYSLAHHRMSNNTQKTPHTLHQLTVTDSQSYTGPSASPPSPLSNPS